MHCMSHGYNIQLYEIVMMMLYNMRVHERSVNDVSDVRYQGPTYYRHITQLRFAVDSL